MHGLKLLSDSIPKLTGQVFSRKYIMLGRLVTHWNDIVGPDLAGKTQPVKLRYMKRKTDQSKSVASLDISCRSADATILHYRKDLILERINQIFGDNWVGSIRFVPQAGNTAQHAGKTVKPRKTLTETEKQRLSDWLEKVDDPDLQEKLKSLGTAIMESGKK